MSANTNQSGTWDPIKNIYAKAAGNWNLVKRAFVNVGGTWKQFHGGNAFIAYSIGLKVTSISTNLRGLWVNGAQAFAATRSYDLIVFDKFGNVTSQTAFDVFGDGSNYANAGSATNNLIAALNALAAGTPYLLCTYDEPQMNAQYLTSTMTSLFGGTTSILGSAVPYRGAYMALGLAKQAPCVETYSGTEDGTLQGTADGIVEYSFRIFNGQIVNVTALNVGGSTVYNSNAVAAPTVSGLA